ncbi:hypothetical protein L7F22_004274 [Adiantum nelumboides]|nr:hypothetical protein [Adiantum nelumboides]
MPTAGAAPFLPLPRCWKKQRELGRGGCGTVSLAMDTNSSREFVVKTVVCSGRGGSNDDDDTSCPPHGCSRSPESDLNNEFTIFQRLHGCPHALECFGRNDEVDEEGHSVKLLFLEYMDAGSLLDFVLSQSQLSTGRTELNHFKVKTPSILFEDSIRVFTRTILEGLQGLHQRSVVHGDLKCANVLLRFRKAPSRDVSNECRLHRNKSEVADANMFELKLGDFGLSRVYDEKSCMGDIGHYTMRGTFSHMAPEVVEGRGAGPASDVWSLGCTVVEMMQGVGPWGIGEEALLQQALAEPPHIPSHVSEVCKDFLRRCLVRDPSHRATLQELLQHPFLVHYPYEHAPKRKLGVTSLLAMGACNLKKSFVSLNCVHLTTDGDNFAGAGHANVPALMCDRAGHAGAASRGDHGQLQGFEGHHHNGCPIGLFYIKLLHNGHHDGVHADVLW